MLASGEASSIADIPSDPAPLETAESTATTIPSLSETQGDESPISPVDVGSHSNESVSGREGDNEVLLEPGVASVEELLESNVFSKKE